MNRIPIFCFLSIVIFLTACKAKNDTKNEEHPLLKIGAEVVTRMDMTDTVTIYGVIELRNEAFIASQFDGRLKDFSLLRGDELKEGQKIGTIIPPLREALKQAMHEMDSAQQELMANEINEIPLFSPIEGTVLEVLQNNGDVLDKGETILHIIDLRQLDIYGDLPIAYLPRVRELRVLKIGFIDYPHQDIDLKVAAFDGKVDQQKQTIQIRFALNNTRKEFRPGQMVKLSFPDKVHAESLVIPRQALLEEEGIYSVFVVGSGEVQKRTVEIGIKHDDFVEVIAGLDDGERVAVQKVYSLTDGMKVVVQ